jgi:hypothetical protein
MVAVSRVIETGAAQGIGSARVYHGAIAGARRFVYE